MKVTISSSNTEDIDEKYKESARNVLEYLVTLDNIELNWGSGSKSIMNLCYQIFKENNKPMHGYTSKKYAYEVELLKEADHKFFETTYDLKKNIFYDGDIILCLPGGTGTVSEFFSHLEEIRSNDVNKLLVVYDENNHFEIMLKVIDDLVARKFNNDEIYKYFKVANNLDEFKKIIEEWK